MTSCTATRSTATIPSTRPSSSSATRSVRAPPTPPPKKDDTPRPPQKQKKGVFSKKAKARTPEEIQSRLTELLSDHIDMMDELNQVCKHTFTAKRLGLSIVIARYGEEGREFVQVESVQPHCEISPAGNGCCPTLEKLKEIKDRIMPTDELIAINDKLILEPTPETFPQILQSIGSAGRPVKFTFILGERREEAYVEQEELRGMKAHEKVPMKDDPFKKFVVLARTHAGKAAKGLADTVEAVQRRAALEEVASKADEAEGGALLAAPVVMALKKEPCDERDGAVSKLKAAVAVTVAAHVRKARQDADAAKNAKLAYEDLLRAEAAAAVVVEEPDTFAAEQVDGVAALVGVGAKDKKTALAADEAGAAILPPAAGYLDDARWACGEWEGDKGEGVEAYGAALGGFLGAVAVEDAKLDVSFSKSKAYEIRCDAGDGAPVVERGVAGTPVFIGDARTGKKLAKTLTIDGATASFAVETEGGQTSVYARGVGGTLTVTSTFPSITELKAVVTFRKKPEPAPVMMMNADDDDDGKAMEGLADDDEDEDPFARFAGMVVDPAIALEQINSVMATAGFNYKDQRSTLSPAEEDAWNIFIMTEHCAPDLEWLCGQWTHVATEGLDEYNLALGSPVQDTSAPSMDLGIAVSGDKYFEIHVRSNGKYFIERGEFGKPINITNSAFEVLPKLCDVSTSGKTFAAGTPGAQIVQIKRMSPTDPDILMTTSYPTLTDAVVCRVFTLKHKWACVNGVGSGDESGDVGMSYMLDGDGPTPQSSNDDAFDMDAACGAGCYTCVA